jgi:Signal transduction histidine kinase
MLEEFDKQLLQSKLEMREQTFAFISEEIHDNVGQILGLAKVQLCLMEERGQHNPELIRDAKENLGKAMSELRDLARSLNSDRIQQFDLLKNLEEEVYRINKNGLGKISLIHNGHVSDIRNEQKLILFRVIQESLHNTVKHAQASSIQIKMEEKDHQLAITLEDDGKGFDVNQTMQSGNGLGLRNMQKRVDLIGGTFKLESSPGKGTKINITVYNE